MRILIINVLYPPAAFGGATIVTAETAKLLKMNHGHEVIVLTMDSSGLVNTSTLLRYEYDKIPVIAVSESPMLSYEENYLGSHFAVHTRSVIRSISPDHVLIHCIQNIGVEFIKNLKELKIPYSIFVHDAWWLCERQFMVNRDGYYCGQDHVNYDICRYCVNDIDQTKARGRYLSAFLEGADNVIFPSRYFMSLYERSGLNRNNFRVIKNGVKKPKKIVGRAPYGKVRFGFVGGHGPAKGSPLIKRVFEGLAGNYELVCVDNLMNLGRSTPEFRLWNVIGDYRVRPSYSQDTIDEFYNEIDVLLFPSQCKESFGLSVREALIRDKWVICTNGGGTVEDIIDGVNGRIIPFGNDTKYFRAAVCECLDIDWNNYSNINRDDIVTFESQAEELARLIEAGHA